MGTGTRRPLSDADLLTRAQRKSGMTGQDFARRILGRDERTLRRYQRAERPLPGVVRERLESYLNEPEHAA
jgi:hypothetical protein